MSLFKKNTKIVDGSYPTPIPGSLAILLWGFYKLDFFTKEQVKEFWDEIGHKSIPHDANEMIKELDDVFEKVKK